MIRTSYAVCLASLGDLTDKFSKMLADHHLNGLEVASCGMIVFVVMSVFALGVTSVRGARRSRRAL